MAKNNLTFTKVGQKYESEYTGESGILQLRLNENAHIIVLGDAGAGYMQIDEMRGSNLVRTLNMAGLTKVKFVSDGPIAQGVVNEF
jgi:hypothetical protein